MMVVPKLEVAEERLTGDDTVVWSSGPSFGAVQVRVVFDGGAELDGDVPGAAHLAVAMMERGTTALDREALHEAFEGLGAQVHGAVQRDAAVFSLRCLEEVLPDALALFGAFLTTPSDDREELGDAIDELNDDVMLQLESPSGAVSRVLPTALWPGHPWATPTDGTRGTRRRVDRKVLRATRRALMARPAWFGVAADDPQRHGPALRALRDQLRTAYGTSASRVGSPPPVSPIAHVLAHVEDEAQAEVMIAGPGPGVGEPGWDAAVMHHAVWSAGFGSPLVRTIRSEHGLSYDVHSSLSGTPGESLHVMRMAPSPEDAARTIALTAQAWRDLADAGVHTDDLERARALLLGEHVAGLDTVRRRLGAAMSLARQGRAVSELWEQPARLLELGADAVAAASSAYGPGTDRWCWVASSCVEAPGATWDAVRGEREVLVVRPEELA